MIREKKGSDETAPRRVFLVSRRSPDRAGVPHLHCFSSYHGTEMQACGNLVILVLFKIQRV